MDSSRADPLAGAMREAKALFEAGKFGLAEQACRRALAVRPRHAESLHLLGLIAYSAHRYEDAVALMQRALSIERGQPFHYANLGLALQAQGNLEKALKALRRAVTQQPTNAAFHSNLGFALKDAGAIDSALVSFNRALALDPRFAGAHVGRALCLLATGRIPEAWPDHAWRADYMGQLGDTHEAANMYGVRRRPSTVLADLTGKRILLVREQGLGDELFFLRYAPAFKEATAASFAYAGSPKLAPLLTRAPWLDMFVEYGAPPPPHDFAFAIGDIPLLAGALSAEPQDALPLTALERARMQARERLASAGPAPYLGITWRAGRAPLAGSPGPLRKHIPIELFGNAVSGWRGTAIILQRGPLPGELAAFARASGLRIADLSDCNEDLELMLGVLDEIDEYVGVSNTNMHLRAGLSKTARVLIPFPPEWRWTFKLERSPWFRAFPLYREDRIGGWQSALLKLKADITARRRE